jgi:hypothetical protein
VAVLVGVSVMVGVSVGISKIATVITEVPVAVPSLLVAVTMERRCIPTSSAVRVYVDENAPGIATQVVSSVADVQRSQV